MFGLTTEEKIELLQLIEERNLRIKRNAIDKFYPDSGENRRELYAKHMQFFKAGSAYKLRLFQAANRVGKTFAASFEITCHVTGRYPHWWQGKRFEHPNNWWVCGVDSALIQSALQPALLGKVGEFGTGMIPYDCLDFDTLKEAKKADTGIQVFKIKHASGGFSSIEFKSYESGRRTFQSVAANIWLDEEPPLPIFTECLLRTASTSVDPLILMMTFTPLDGISGTVQNFFEGADFREGEVGPGKHATFCTWDDVPHLSESDKVQLMASIPPWQRDARTRGIPSMGSGAIYPIPMSDIKVPRFEIPKHWKRYAGMDVGNKTAAIWFAINPDTGVHYAYHEYYREGELPAVHAASIILPGKWIPIAIDHAAHGRSQIDGKNLFDMYKDLGLDLHNADKSVETGLYTCWELMSSGRLKIFDDLKKFFDEYQIYRRDDKGRIVKEKDHLMDAFRYGIMTGRDLAVNEMQAAPAPYMPGMVSTQYRPQSLIRR
jgi:phage terminase large subunit-like protein